MRKALLIWVEPNEGVNWVDDFARFRTGSSSVPVTPADRHPISDARFVIYHVNP